MNTKDIVWKLFTEIMLPIAKEHNKKQLNFAELMTTIHKAGKP
jgi:hypothetical protein